MGIANFPAELVESVIDELQRDESTLLNCSLVSKQWLPRSRYHCFSSVTLSADLEGLPQIHRFLSLLDSPGATFITCITKL
ncbi:hypothetical protein DFH06DRAFT_999532, partial [Mycena polygramma]